ncbi:MAG: von Willebrand factor type A domain-containing protein [Fibrobacteres bacterium]|nr:von Willebrand factor type A domain-containing protein [Fibrobacterota bacterium]
MNRHAACLSLAAVLLSACTLKRAEPEAVKIVPLSSTTASDAAPVSETVAAAPAGALKLNAPQPAGKKAALVPPSALSNTRIGGRRDFPEGSADAYSLPVIPAAPAPRSLQAPSRKEYRDAERCARCYPEPTVPAEASPTPNSEEYAAIYENPFLESRSNPLSTFSIDVDGASYSNTRRFIQEGQLPPADAVRIEEFVNYFDYDYPQPTGSDPFSISTEIASTPWNASTKLVRIGLQGRRMEASRLPPNNLVFLIDVSGSMNTPEKLPLLKDGFRMLIDQLRPQDKVSIVVYAGAAGMVLPPTPGSDKESIREALDRLEAGGSTAGGAGLRMAYQAAQNAFIRGGNNRVILATDGDFNVGVSNDADLIRLIESERGKGVFLSVLGFGTGNYKDAKMEQLADKGDGNYYYVDNINEARKVLVEKLAGTLFAIAKDVKLQVEFNPAAVSSYRLIGYENRALAAEDFNDDRKDAGELGAGASVTALYEIVPAAPARPKVDPLKYQDKGGSGWNWGWGKARDAELLTVKFRYKQPGGSTSKLISRSLKGNDAAWQDASEDFRFAAAAAGFGLVLRGSRFRGDLDFDKVAAMANGARGRDTQGRRAEFATLVDQARALAGNGRVGYRGYGE